MAYLFDQESADFVCQFVSRLPTTDTGKPFNLYPWQVSTLNEFYGQMETSDDGDIFRKYWYLYLEIPKKNGKSELAAALGIYHLLGDGELNAEVYLCAADKANASIIYNAALFMVESTPWLSKKVAMGELKLVKSSKKIEYRRKIRQGNGTVRWVTIGMMQVLSAEAYSKHGYKPSCVIFDELHAQPNRELWDVMTFGSGSGRRQPVYIVLTTAGDDPDHLSIGWEIHQKAVGVRDARTLKALEAQGKDTSKILSLQGVAPEDMETAKENLREQDLPNWLPILYGLTAVFGEKPEVLESVDIWDESLWYLCNPSLGQHLKIRTLRLEAIDAKKSEAGEKLFRWLRLNQWISIKAVSWISINLYDKCQWKGTVDDLRGKLCYGGVDLSTSRDMTAFTLYFPPQAGLEVGVWLPYIWRPGGTVADAARRDHVPYQDWERAGFLTLCEGDIIDYPQVEEQIIWAKEQFDLQVVGFDPYLSRTLTQRLAPIVDVIEIPQDVRNMSPAMKEIDLGMAKKTMLHVHNTCYRWTFGNVRCHVDGNGNLKPLKNKSTGRIDPVVSTIIAVAVAMVMRNKPRTLADAMNDGNWGM